MHPRSPDLETLAKVLFYPKRVVYSLGRAETLEYDADDEDGKLSRPWVGLDDWRDHR